MMPSLAKQSPVKNEVDTFSDSEEVSDSLLRTNQVQERADSQDETVVPADGDGSITVSEERVDASSSSRRAGKRKQSPSTSSTAPTTASASALASTSTLYHQQRQSDLAPPPPRGGQAKSDPMICTAAPQLIPPSTNVPLPPSQFEFFTTRAHPVNQRGYRYIPCGPSPKSSLPTPIQKVIESLPQSIRWSWEDRSTFMLLTQDARTITAEKGWRAVRANVGLREGNWYWEYKVHRGGGEVGEPGTAGSKEGSWVRLGVGRRESPLNAPVGFDGHSYAYRDKGGEAVTLARPTPYGKPYKSGSTIGIYLSLPPQPAPPAEDPSYPSRLIRKRVPIRYKGSLYFELLEYSPSKEMEQLAADPAHLKSTRPLEDERKKVAPGQRVPLPSELDEPPPRELPVLEGAKIAFFVDGECQGVAFEDLFDFVPLAQHEGHRARVNRKGDPRLNNHDDGTLGYFPFASVFGGAIVEINPGPNFDFPPPENIEEVLRSSPKPPRNEAVIEDAVKGKGWRPLCDRYGEWFKEQAWMDDLDELENVRQFEEGLEERLAAMQQIRREQEQEAGPLKKSKKTATNVGEVEVKKEIEESPVNGRVGSTDGAAEMQIDAK